jgi:hypothetical protein
MSIMAGFFLNFMHFARILINGVKFKAAAEDIIPPSSPPLQATLFLANLQAALLKLPSS